MVIIEIPNWMIYISWFVLVNLGIVITAILWLVYKSKRDLLNENKQ